MGRKTLVDMARVTGGIERTAWDDVFQKTGLRNRQIRDLILPLTVLLLVLHVGEIAGRRLLAFAAASAWLRSRRLPQRSSWWRRPPAVVDVPATGVAASDVGSALRRATKSDPVTGQGSAEPVAPNPPRTPAESPLARAKARAKSRLGE